jgi:hypothetical protein
MNFNEEKLNEEIIVKNFLIISYELIKQCSKTKDLDKKKIYLNYINYLRKYLYISSFKIQDKYNIFLYKNLLIITKIENFNTNDY